MADKCHYRLLERLERRQLLAVSIEPNGVLLITGTARDDKIILSWNSTSETVLAKINGEPIGTDWLDRFHAIVVDTRRGDDFVQVFSQVDPSIDSNSPPFPITIWTHAGNDTILGGDGSERLNAGDDDDVVNGGNGRDTIYGGPGPGNDSLRGGGGSDYLDGEEGNDTIRGDGGNDHLLGGANSDRLRGSAGNDTLEGGGGRDLLAGEDGEDALFGGPGSDIIHGGQGGDTLRGGPNHDAIYISDADHDDFDYDEASAGESIDADIRAAAGLPTPTRR